MPLVSRVRPRIDDVIELVTPKGLAYAHYTHNHKTPPHYGALLRVLPGFFAERPGDFSEIVKKPPVFMTFFPLGAACNRGLVRIVANEPLSESSKIFPTFRSSHAATGPFFLWDGTREWRVAKLNPDELRKYPPLGVWNDTLLIERIAGGWSHEQDP